jgi:hypothetical protein
MRCFITPKGQNYGAYRIGNVFKQIKKRQQNKSFNNSKEPTGRQEIEGIQQQFPGKYPFYLLFIEYNKPKNTQTQDEHNHLICIYHRV